MSRQSIIDQLLGFISSNIFVYLPSGGKNPIWNSKMKDGSRCAMRVTQLYLKREKEKKFKDILS